MAWSWCCFFRGLLHRSPRGLAQTRLFLIKRVNESTAETGEPRKLQGLRLLLPRASEDVDLPAFLLHLRGWTGHPAPRACLALPQGDPGRDPLLTWSCLRAFCACSGFLYSTNPNPMDSSAPERDRVGSRTRAPGGEENKEAGTDQVQGFPGAPWTSPQLSDFFTPLLVSRKTPAPGVPFITGRLEESANAVTEPPPEAWWTIN